MNIEGYSRSRLLSWVMFYLMSLGIVGLDLHKFVVELHCAAARGYTPWLLFLPGMSVRQCERKGPWLNIPPWRREGLLFVCIEDTGSAAWNVHVHIRVIWGALFEVERVRKRGLPCEGSADAVPLSDDSLIIPSEETGGSKLYERT